MPIPKYQEIYKPILNLLANGLEWKSTPLYEAICDHFKLSEEERSELLPSGTQVAINNRCLWALFYLKKAMLVRSLRRGHYQITESGMKFIRNTSGEINNESLLTIEPFSEFLNKKNIEGNAEIVPAENAESPLDKIEAGHAEIRAILADELLEKVKSVKPNQFEHIVLDLILKMGYGGSRIDAGKVVGKSGDGGIDGVIKEDRLGLDVIYIQAKRWEGTVGRPEIQKFAGALQMHRAKKGIFITTSSFSQEAKEYVNIIESKITLINGIELCELMIEFNVGVYQKNVYTVKDIDGDYFDE